jgi:hypothetical protein
MQTHSLGNIIREVPIDLSAGDFTALSIKELL